MENTTAEVLPPIENGRIAAFNATEAGLAALRAELEGKTFDCSDRAQDAEARAARRNLVTLRTTIEARRKELKAPLLARGKLLDDEAKRITGEIAKLEDPIDAQIKAEEERKTAEKAARERAEAERAAKVMHAINVLRQRPVVLATADSHAIELALLELDGADPLAGAGADPTDAEAADAAAALEQTITSLRTLADGARAREAEAEQLRRERAELDREREAEAERQRQAAANAAAERAKEAEAARIEREAEQARLEEQRRVDQQRIDRENEIERQRLADEAERLRQEREAADRQRAAEREAELTAQRARWASRKVLKGAAMTDVELDALVILLEGDDLDRLDSTRHDALADWADAEAHRHGFTGWIDALHGLAHATQTAPAEAAA